MRHVITYTTTNGDERTIGKFGKTTQKEFDEAIASLPGLIGMARAGNVKCGETANELLWALANESFNTRETKAFECIHTFGRKS